MSEEQRRALTLVLEAFGVTEDDLAEVGQLDAATEAARAELNHFADVILPERMAATAAELSIFLPKGLRLEWRDAGGPSDGSAQT